MTAQPHSTPRLSMGAGTCLRGALEFAWYRESASAGTDQLLLALVARGDPISSRALAEAGVTYRAVCGVLDEAGRRDDADGGIGAAPGESVAAGILAEAAGWIRPPGRLARLLRLSHSMPRRPLPSWTRNMETVVDGAVRSAQAAGRDKPCRADMTVALLSQEDCTAAEVLARLRVDRERLPHRLAEMFGADGPAPTSLTDLEIRPAGWVLGYLLRSGICALPGRHDSDEWRVGLTRMVAEKIEEIGAELGHPSPGAEHVLLAIIATYEDLAADGEQFGPGWEACFPAGQALASYGITYRRARQVMLDLSRETNGDGPIDAHSVIYEIRKLTGITPTTKDGLDEVIRLLGHRPKGKGPVSGTEVSLLGVLHEKNHLAGRMLAEFGVDKERLRRTLIDSW